MVSTTCFSLFLLLPLLFLLLASTTCHHDHHQLSFMINAAELPAMPRIKTLTTKTVTQAQAPVPLMRTTSDGNNFVSPVSTTNLTMISSPFAPRWKYSQDRYDFHRGIDFYGEKGNEIYAIGTGEVFKKQTYSGGGLTLYIEHTLSGITQTFHGKTITRMFSIYNHLDSVETGVDIGVAVTAGQLIGKMGSTGDTSFVHLHTECRLQGYCSLSYQELNGVYDANSKCFTGFDPHVNPLLFYLAPLYTDNSKILEEIQVLNSSYVYAVRYNTTRGHMDLETINTSLGSIILDTRLGINAKTEEKIDDFLHINSWLTLIPGVFYSTTGNKIYYDFHFRERPDFFGIYDIYGNGIEVDISSSSSSSSSGTTTNPSPGGSSSTTTTTTTSSPSSGPSSSSSEETSSAAIIGGAAAGGGIVLIVIIILVWFFVFKKKNDNNDNNDDNRNLGQNRHSNVNSSSSDAGKYQNSQPMLQIPAQEF